MLDYAIAYARQGCRVFPVVPGGKVPLTAHGFHDATTDEKQIEAWWAQTPEANVGIATGKVSNIVVVDVDRHGEDGTASLPTLNLPPTKAVKTPRDGYHLYFRYPETGNIGRVIGALPGIDLLGDDGYVVACGSRVGGKFYEIFRDREPVACPPQLLDLAAKKRAPKVRNGSKVSEGGRNDYLASTAGVLRREGLNEDAIRVALEAENSKRCDPPLSVDEVATIARSIARYEGDSLEPQQPVPLVRPVDPARPYPILALGPILAPAAQAIMGHVQVPDGLAAHSVLGFACLAAQAHADVHTLGGVRPISLNMLTIAGSGERKTASDRLAGLPVHERRKNLQTTYRTQLREYEAARAAHKMKVSKAKEQAESPDDLAQAIRDIRVEPPPRRPFFIVSEPTAEGLFISLADGQLSQALSTDEGGQFLGSYAMGKDSELRTITLLSRLWDGSPIDRVRAKDREHVTLFGRRLAVHLMAQPAVATLLLGKELYRSQGMLGRFLICSPSSTIGTREYHGGADPQDDGRLKRYWFALRELLQMQPCEDHDAGGLSPPALSLSQEAHGYLVDFYNQAELAQREGGELEAVREFASKAAEHACRLAAVITLLSDPKAASVTLQAMEGAVELAEFYINEHVRLLGVAGIQTETINATKLLEWIRRKALKTVTARNVMQFGPYAIRESRAARNALKLLNENLWLTTEDGVIFTVPETAFSDEKDH
jgi:hypothetical protein